MVFIKVNIVLKFTANLTIVSVQSDTFPAKRKAVSMRVFILHNKHGCLGKVKPSILNLSGFLILETLFGCHDILILGESIVRCRQRPDITITVDLDVKHQLKLKRILLHLGSGLNL